MAKTAKQKAIQHVLNNLEAWGISGLNNHWSASIVAQIKGYEYTDVPVAHLYEMSRVMECVLKATFAINPNQTADTCDRQVAERLHQIPEKLIG